MNKCGTCIADEINRIGNSSVETKSCFKYYRNLRFVHENDAVNILFCTVKKPTKS